MVHVLEGTSVSLPLAAADRIQSALQLPDAAFSYLRSHGTLDREHTAHFEELLNCIEDSQDQADIVHAVRVFYRLYGDVFRNLPMAATNGASGGALAWHPTMLLATGSSGMRPTCRMPTPWAGWRPLRRSGVATSLSTTPACRPSVAWSRLRALHQHRGTLSVAPNFAYEILAAKVPDDELQGLDLSAWRVAGNGTEPVHAATLARFAERFQPYGLDRCAMMPMYGLAENGVGLAFPALGRGPRIDRIDRRTLHTDGRAEPVNPAQGPTGMQVVCCGQPLAGHEIRVVDARGEELPEPTLATTGVDTSAMVSRLPCVASTPRAKRSDIMSPMSSNNPSTLDAARRRIARLREALGARLIETHISWVLLTATEAYKVKKPVRLPFLDFATLSARRHFCEEEVRLNGRLAPSLYLGVAEVHDSPLGPTFDGDGPVVDAAVRMQRFPDGALWSDMLSAGTLAPRHIDAMALRLATFHRDAPTAPAGSDFGSSAIHRRVASGLMVAVDAWTETRQSDMDWPALRAWIEGQLRQLAPLWLARRRDGRVRECHGDLHMANVLQIGEEASAFDGIEFDDALRWIDVLDDVAFLAMDLLAHGQRGLAFRFVNAWLEQSGDYTGLPALRFYMVCRALVRWQVAAIGEGEGLRQHSGIGAADYMALAATLSRGADPRLAIMHGLPGSGKTFVSQGVMEAAGAIRLRSDVERKRLFGLALLASSRELVPGGIYHPAATARTYKRLQELARIALLAGWPVVIDAAFLRRSERAEFVILAASLAVPHVLFHCQAPLAMLRHRVDQRLAQGGDASEADMSVLERLVQDSESLDDGERKAVIEVRTDEPLDAALLAQRWQRVNRTPSA